MQGWVLFGNLCAMLANLTMYGLTGDWFFAGLTVISFSASAYMIIKWPWKSTEDTQEVT